METSEINWSDETIDSREVIARQEELISEAETLQLKVDDLIAEIKELETEGETSLTYEKLETLREALSEAESELYDFEELYGGELEELASVVSQGEDSPDWVYGEALIHEDYFEDYIKDQISDCYVMPEEFTSGKWPWNHMEMDWYSAAEEAKQDYSEIEINGNILYIRS
jgi:predicted nuclease with TOPRIM domain